ncbi:hypothetical protein CDL15_Pgr005731 [Punica granatum]|uniref:Uncharacterized protein n=1 Tax=Punica granatum TaxID=22663 RepID=A0A218WFC5_PUNGR|nr:hypothetical protein CDL15_Pgr005731 [Punica granatum]
MVAFSSHPPVDWYESLPFTASPLLKLAKPISHSRPFSLIKVLTPLTVVPAAAYTPYPVSTPATHLKLFGSFVARCISSSSVNSAHTLEWNEPVSCSEFGALSN